MIKLIAMDMDGTLLQPDHTVSAGDAAAIAKAQSRGVVCAIATGRMFPSALPYAEALKMTGPMICCNGAHVANCATGETLIENTLSPEEGAAVARWADARGLYIQAYLPGMYYFKERCAYSDGYAESAGVVGQTAERWPMEAALTKLLFIGQPDVIARTLPEARAAFPELSLACSVPKYIEVTSRAANKGGALAALAAGMNISREEVMAIGDSENDESMLAWAGHSVAMGNAAKEIIAICRHTTLDNTQDGVAHAIRSIVMKERA